MLVSTHLTVAALEGLPENDGKRYELFEGDLHVTTQPSVEHQLVADAVCELLRAWNRKHGQGGLTVSAPGVILANDEAFAPDVVWYSATRRASYRRPEGKFYGPPDLAVEVLSKGQKNEQRDRVLKPARYAYWGINEYWLVDRFARNVVVHRLTGADYAIVATLAATATLTSPWLPDFACVVGEFFADLAE
ncbi:MAG: Uma2 family endonuclease [Candidatus Viridilinea halotolerans]|uniref:Uma2 family endonuclease n=1 Tax=Candidatus Viridilinea halotolerans TaxID=2491704 RepID=A0A426TX07_9CHLR|nr:MAG: Uma2 family endonuclease [Candidatus Viridilinea halotolerans]